MDHLQQLIIRYPCLENVSGDIQAAFDILCTAYKNGGKLLAAGNGGSAADSGHIIGELMKSFVKKRALPDTFVSDIAAIDNEIAGFLVPRLQPALPAISLCEHTSLNTAIINDLDGNITFAQQVYGYGNAGDVFLGISTSGNSKNILYAAVTAKAKLLKVIALSGGTGGLLKNYADVSIIVPETETYKIQELHLPVYHCLCLMLEDFFF
jgi:D-sedoheptulose 7-phosphate isomerase